MFSFQPPLLWPNACIYSVLEEVIQVQHQWDTPSFGWGSSSHEPSGGAQYTSNNLLEMTTSKFFKMKLAPFDLYRSTHPSLDLQSVQVRRYNELGMRTRRQGRENLCTQR